MFLKSGDRIVCLKDYITRNFPNGPLYTNYIKNKVYTIDSYHNEGYQHYKITGEFVIVNFSLLTFDNWFITLKKSRKNKLENLKYGKTD